MNSFYKALINSIIFGIFFFVSRLIIQNLLLKKEIPKFRDVISITFSYSLNYILKELYLIFLIPYLTV